MHHWYVDYYVADVVSQKALVEGVERRLGRMWPHLDGVLADGPYMLGRRFSAVDYYLFMLLRWSRNMARPGYQHGNLGRLYELVGARPAMQAVFRREGLA